MWAVIIGVVGIGLCIAGYAYAAVNGPRWAEERDAKRGAR